MKYFLDHPQIKRKKALGNGSTPEKKDGGKIAESEVKLEKGDGTKKSKEDK